MKAPQPIEIGIAQPISTTSTEVREWENEKDGSSSDGSLNEMNPEGLNGLLVDLQPMIVDVVAENFSSDSDVDEAPVTVSRLKWDSN